MRILFVLENYYPHIGGVETLFKNLAHKLSEQDHKVVILTTLKDNKDLKYEAIGNIEIHRKNYRNRYFFTFFALFEAFRLAKSCDLIHTTSYNAALPAYIAAKFRRKKVIITFHEVWAKLWFNLPFMTKLGSRLHYMFEQMILMLSFDRFIGVSDFTAKALLNQGVSPKRVEMIYNGIDYAEFANNYHKTPDSFVFTFFGRLGMSKGIEILLKAIKRLPKLANKVSFQLIIPTTPLPFFKEINDLIDSLELRNRLVMKHNLPFEELKNEIANSSAVVIPSYSEGFCFAAVETMAIGTPIISSGKGALSEVISGKYIELETLSAEALKDAMLEAIQGNWKENNLKRFELKDTVEKYISLYQNIILN